MISDNDDDDMMVLLVMIMLVMKTMVMTMVVMIMMTTGMVMTTTRAIMIIMHIYSKRQWYIKLHSLHIQVVNMYSDIGEVIQIQCTRLINKPHM